MTTTTRLTQQQVTALRATLATGRSNSSVEARA